MHTFNHATLKTAAFAATFLTVSALAISPVRAQFGSNLIVNGNAEAGPGSASSNDIEPVPSFTTTGSFTVVQYGPNGGPLPTDPGPADRGLNYFAGGPNNASSSAAQLINLLPEASVINAGKAAFTLSAYLGGYDGQNDNAILSLSFLGAGGAALGSAQIGPVSSADRGGTSGLLFRSMNGFVPIGAQSVNVNLQMTRTDGAYNDGYADDLSLVLNASPVPEASTTASFGLLLALGVGGLVVGARKRRKA